MNAISKFVLQALTPSWKFFEEVGHIPRLSVRTGDSAWTEWTPTYSRGISELFINPRGNFDLAKVTLVERFVEEISGMGDNATADTNNRLDQQVAKTIIEGTSYALVKALSREIVATLWPNATRFQFRIELIDQQIPSAREEIFISEECEA